jgi:hypothetical protein
MAKPTKRKVPGGVAHAGRVTAGSGSAARTESDARPARPAPRPRPTASSRYTPPVPVRAKGGPSGRLVPIVMFTLLGVGVLMIVINYLSVLLPGAPSNWYIVGGLGVILAGIMVATQWR